MSFVRCSELGEREVEFAGGEMKRISTVSLAKEWQTRPLRAPTPTGLWCEKCAKSVTTCPKCSATLPSVPHRNAHVIKQLKNKLVFCANRVKREPAVIKPEPPELDCLAVGFSQENDRHDSKRVKVGSLGGVSFDETQADMIDPSSPLRTTGSVSFDSVGADRPSDVLMMDEAVAAGETEVKMEVASALPATAAATATVTAVASAAAANGADDTNGPFPVAGKFAAENDSEQQPSSQMEESYRSPVVIVGMQGVNEQQSTATLEQDAEPKLMDQCVPGEGEEGDGESELGKRKTGSVEQEGCVWVGQLGELAHHLASSCPFEVVLCGHHDCHEHVQRGDLTAHSAQCLQRPSTCLHSHMVPFKALSEHESACPMSPYVCMCGAKMLLGDEDVETAGSRT